MNIAFRLAATAGLILIVAVVLYGDRIWGWLRRTR